MHEIKQSDVRRHSECSLEPHATNIEWRNLWARVLATYNTLFQGTACFLLCLFKAQVQQPQSNAPEPSLLVHRHCLPLRFRHCPGCCPHSGCCANGAEKPAGEGFQRFGLHGGVASLPQHTGDQGGHTPSLQSGE